MGDTSLQDVDISENLKEDISLFRALKPYLAHCLTLNHEINNLLAGVIGHADLLLNISDGLTNRQKKGLLQIIESAERIKKLIEGLSAQKIALAEKADLKSFVQRHKKVAIPLD